MLIPIASHRILFNRSITGLKYLGLWSIQSQSSYLKFVYYIYQKLLFCLVVIFIGTLAADLIQNYNNVMIATDDGCYLAGIVVILFKLWIFQTKHKDIKQVLEDIHEPLDTLERSSDLGVLTVIRTKMFHETFTGNFFTGLGIFLAVALIFFVPKEEGALPIRATFPFNTKVSPWHEIAFFIQGSTVFYGLLTIVLMDELITTSIGWINVQLLILTSNYSHCDSKIIERATLKPSIDVYNRIQNFKIMKIDEEQSEIKSFAIFHADEVDELNDNFIWRYKTCIKNQQKIIQIVDDINSIFSNSFLMQIFASFSMICLTGFQAVLGSGGKQNLLKFVVYLGAALSQLFNWSVFGTLLLYESTSLSKGQWMSGWERELHPDVRALMITSLMRTRYSLQLRAGKFFIMSLETFIHVLKNSYSFFALLTNLTVE